MVTAQAWDEQFRRSARVNPSAKQFFCLGDCNAAGFAIEYPKDSVRTIHPSQMYFILSLTAGAVVLKNQKVSFYSTKSWYFPATHSPLKQYYVLIRLIFMLFPYVFLFLQPSTWTTMLGLMPIVPMTKWRALAEWIASKDKQKAAFSRAHGPFLYLMAFADASGRQDSEACLAVIQSVFQMADASQQVVYIDARPKQRPWLKAHGFADIMGYKVRKSEKAPQIFIMYRSPAPAPAVLPR